MSDTKISEFPEKALSSLDAAGTADFVGGYDVVSNNKTNKKFTFATLANWLLTKFKLTIAGSSQTVKSAVDTLNSKKQPYFSEATFTSGADLNQIFYGTYCCNTNPLHNSILHKPDGMGTAIWRFTVVPLTNDGASNPTAPANWSRRAQIIYTGETEYWRVYQVDGSGNIEWGDWVETPKRSEITAINSKVHDFGSIGNGMTYAQIFEHVYSSIPDGVFVFSVNSSGAKMFVGVKNGSNYAAALYINFNGSWGRVINDNGTFSQS